MARRSLTGSREKLPVRSSQLKPTNRGILSLVSTSGAPAFQSKLEKLVMAGTCVTDKSLDLLARHLATLKHLDVSGSEVTEGGTVKFSERRPDCQLKAEALMEEQASNGVVKEKEEDDDEGGDLDKGEERVGGKVALNENCDS